MCPNVGINSRICPGISGTPHTMDTECRFVKTYVDNYGNIKRAEINEGISFDKAQSKLNLLAREKKWYESK